MTTKVRACYTCTFVEYLDSTRQIEVRTKYTKKDGSVGYKRKIKDRKWVREYCAKHGRNTRIPLVPRQGEGIEFHEQREACERISQKTHFIFGSEADDCTLYERRDDQCPAKKPERFTIATSS
jgi:hypothetical protein